MAADFIFLKRIIMGLLKFPLWFVIMSDWQLTAARALYFMTLSDKYFIFRQVARNLDPRPLTTY